MDARARRQELARARGQAVPRPARRRRAGLPPPGRAAAGDRLHRRARRAAAAGATSAPRSRRSSATAPEEFVSDPGLWAASCTPTTASGRSTQETEDAPRQPRHARRSSTGCSPATARSSGSSTRRCWKPTRTGVPVWHGVLYDITERKRDRAASCSAPLAQQAVVARLGERALQDGDPEELMRGRHRADRRGRRRPQRLHLGARPRRPPPQPARRPRGGGGRRRPPRLRRPRLPRRRRARLRHPRDRRRLATRRRRFTMPPVLRVFGAASSLAVVIDGKDRPFGVLDVHSTEPHRFTRQGRALRAGRGQRPRRRDRAPRRRPGAAPPRPPRLAHRPAQPAQLRRRARRRARAKRPSPARRSGSSSSTSTTSS